MRPPPFRTARTRKPYEKWFIVIPEFQKRGIGSEMVRRAVAFCRNQGYPKLFLWTFSGLDLARRVYEKSGFRLCAEHDVAQWGQRIREQKFESDLHR